MYFVYVIRSEISHQLYKGVINNLSRRLKEHNAGSNTSTKHGRSWRMVYHESCQNRKEARQREKYLKSGIGREYLKTILAS